MEQEQTQEAIKERLTGRAEQNQTSSLSLNCFPRYLFDSNYFHTRIIIMGITPIHTLASQLTLAFSNQLNALCWASAISIPFNKDLCQSPYCVWWNEAQSWSRSIPMWRWVLGVFCRHLIMFSLAFLAETLRASGKSKDVCTPGPEFCPGRCLYGVTHHSVGEPSTPKRTLATSCPLKEQRPGRTSLRWTALLVQQVSAYLAESTHNRK